MSMSAVYNSFFWKGLYNYTSALISVCSCFSSAKIIFILQIPSFGNYVINVEHQQEK